jgi:IrrE N-terminal-like domain
VTHYRSPQRLLEELGITEPEDIDIEAIAFHVGALIKYAPLSGCEARVLGAGDRAIITVNEKAPRGRQRFSASHELGHWMHDRNKARFRCTATDFVSAWVSDDPERRANRYGAELLMPTSMIQPRIAGKPLDFATVSTVAEEFSTSLTAAAIRVVELSTLPAMLICNERYRRKWFLRSKDVPTWLWPRDTPTSASVAHDLFASKEKHGASTVIVGAWFGHEDGDRYELHEDARRVGEYVLSLISWPNEEHLLAVIDGRVKSRYEQ